MNAVTTEPDKIAAALGELPQPAAPALVLAQVTRAFERLGSEEDARGQLWFMPTLDRAYGVRVPDVRKLAQLVHRAYRDDVDLCRSIALASWPQESREHRLFALFLLERLKLAPAEYWALGARFLQDVVTWEDCDQLCAAALGQALAADPQYMDELEMWVEDENFWVRRAALVTAVYLRRSQLDAAVLHDLDRRALAMCARLLYDEEDYIRKAVDWTIREILKRRYDLAGGWLMAQAKQQPGRPASTTLKLSARKLTNEDRRIFLAILGDG